MPKSPIACRPLAYIANKIAEAATYGHQKNGCVVRNRGYHLAKFEPPALQQIASPGRNEICSRPIERLSQRPPQPPAAHAYQQRAASYTVSSLTVKAEATAIQPPTYSPEAILLLHEILTVAADDPLRSLRFI